MKKYRVTDKNPYLIIGGILEVDKSCTINGLEILITNIEIQNWLADKWIEEIQEPEFTKDDLVLFLEYIYKSNDSHNVVSAIYLIWLYENNKCTKEVAKYIAENMDFLKMELKNK